MREPLLHFVVLGALIFAVTSWTPARDEVVVSSGRVEHLQTLFTRSWQRPPSRAELEDLVEQHVLEEIAYREGVARGLDRDDTVIRRRVRQKLDFVAEDSLERGPPNEGELAAFYAEHAGEFADASRWTLQQVFVGEDDATVVLARLRDEPGLDASTVGQPSLLEPRYRGVTAHELANLFGRDFADAAVQLEPGRWHGPLRSGIGAHLVFIEAHDPVRVRPLSEVRGAVLAAWTESRREAALDGFYANLRRRYEVTVQWPTR